MACEAYSSWASEHLICAKRLDNTLFKLPRANYFDLSYLQFLILVVPAGIFVLQKVAVSS